MKRGFTLIELMIVMAILVTLMAVMFRISGIGADADNKTRTIVRLQRLENCLSGYYAAFGSYPPVKMHGARDIYLSVGEHGIQSDKRNESIWGWDPDTFVKWIESGKDKRYRQPAEESAWRQVQAACMSQPVACNFPFPSGYHDATVALSDQMAQLASEGQDEEYEAYWSNPDTRAKLMAGFDDGGSESGGTGRLWQRTITEHPTSVQTAMVFRWFWIVTRAQPSPAWPITSERRSPTYSPSAETSSTATSTLPFIFSAISAAVISPPLSPPAWRS